VFCTLAWLFTHTNSRGGEVFVVCLVVPKSTPICCHTNKLRLSWSPSFGVIQLLFERIGNYFQPWLIHVVSLAWRHSIYEIFEWSLRPAWWVRLKIYVFRVFKQPLLEKFGDPTVLGVFRLFFTLRCIFIVKKCKKK